MGGGGGGGGGRGKPCLFLKNMLNGSYNCISSWSSIDSVSMIVLLQTQTCNSVNFPSVIACCFNASSLSDLNLVVSLSVSDAVFSNLSL